MVRNSAGRPFIKSLVHTKTHVIQMFISTTKLQVLRKKGFEVALISQWSAGVLSRVVWRQVFFVHNSRVCRWTSRVTWLQPSSGLTLWLYASDIRPGETVRRKNVINAALSLTLELMKVLIRHDASWTEDSTMSLVDFEYFALIEVLRVWYNSLSNARLMSPLHESACRVWHLVYFPSMQSSEAHWHRIDDSIRVTEPELVKVQRSMYRTHIFRRSLYRL